MDIETRIEESFIVLGSSKECEANMAKNRSLLRASKEKNDEFYTQLSDIENQLRHYREQFKDKIIFCNCDDPYESNFFKFFATNYNFLGLKKLICTCYAGSPVVGEELSLFDISGMNDKQISNKYSYKIEINEVTDVNGDGAVDLADVEYLLKNRNNVLTLLNGDGDFRSEECIDLFKQSDIIVTNPPFSLFKQYLAQLMQYSKKFLIIGSINAINYKEIFPLIQDNKMWLGYGFNNGNAYFYTKNTSNFADGVYDPNTGLVKFRNCVWYTNLDTTKRYDVLTLYKKYNPKDYPGYYNYDGIEVRGIVDIPYDYDGDMGVPITFLNNYNPDQFQIVGRGNDVKKTVLHKTAGDEIHFIKDGEIIYRVPYSVSERKAGNSLRINDNGKPGRIPYGRIIIRKKV